MKTPSVALPILCAFLTPGLAQGSQHSGQTHGGSVSHHEHKHHLAFFIGGTRGGADTESHSASESSSGSDFTRGDFFTVGVDYQYLILPWMGVGPFIDYAAGNFKATVAGGGVFLQTVRRLSGVPRAGSGASMRVRTASFSGSAATTSSRSAAPGRWHRHSSWTFSRTGATSCMAPVSDTVSRQARPV